MTELIARGEIAVATIDGQLAGAVRVQALDDATGEFGMLAADHAYRRVVRAVSLADAYPDLAPLLATECEFVIYEKPLEVSVSAD